MTSYSCSSLAHETSRNFNRKLASSLLKDICNDRLHQVSKTVSSIKRLLLAKGQKRDPQEHLGKYKVQCYRFKFHRGAARRLWMVPRAKMQKQGPNEWVPTKSILLGLLQLISTKWHSIWRSIWHFLFWRFIWRTCGILSSIWHSACLANSDRPTYILTIYLAYIFACHHIWHSFWHSIRPSIWKM